MTQQPAAPPEQTLAPDCIHCSLPLPRGRRSAGSPFCCVGCHIAYRLQPGRGDPDAPTAPPPFLRLGLAVLLAMNLMVFSWFFYSRELEGAPAIAPEYDVLVQLFAALQMFLCTGVVALLGVPLAADTLAQLLTPVRNARGLLGLLHRLDVQLLILIGVGAAFLLSLLHTFRGEGPLYYDTAAMILVVVAVGRFLEASAKRSAVLSAESVLPQLPDRVVVRRHGQRIEIDAAEITVGDCVQARAGEAVAVDGVVRSGRSRVDEAALSGEARPRRVAPGERVLAGSVNLEGLLVVAAERVGEARAALRMRELLEGARRRQPQIQRLADRVASYFVPGVMLLSLAVFAWHGRDGDLERGLFVALSVVLISCPCALGLAAPLASWHALRRAFERGIVFESAMSLERGAGISCVVFDKTGTLTDPRLELGDLAVADGVEPEDALSRAAALETATLHPLARCLVQAAEHRGLELPEVEGARSLPGLGVEGSVGGERLRLGGSELLRQSGLQPTRLSGPAGDDPSATPLYLFTRDGVQARFRLGEQLRPGASDALAELRRLGVEVAVLTGDRHEAGERIAERLAVETHSQLLPADKVAKLEEMRRLARGGVAAVGDGLNDAPLLAASDLGITLGSATDLAQQSGQVHVVGDRLIRVPEILAISRHAVRRIRFNLAVSFGYNALALPAAASGLLNPVIAALLMVSSSLTVIALSRGAGQMPVDDVVGAAPETASPVASARSPGPSQPPPAEERLQPGGAA